MTEEVKVRNELTEAIEKIVGRWELFAEVYHGKEYTDGEHAYGVLTIEFQELVDRVEDMALLLKDFREEHVMQHNYSETKKLMDCIYDQARFAAEEAAQVAAVAKKAKASGFARRWQVDKETVDFQP